MLPKKELFKFVGTAEQIYFALSKIIQAAENNEELNSVDEEEKLRIYLILEILKKNNSKLV